MELIAAHSPQAKGRVERLFKHLAGSATQGAAACGGSRRIEAANRFLEDYLPGYNRCLIGDDLDLPCLVRYTPRCSFPRIFEAIGGLVQGFDGLFLCGDTASCLMR